MNKQLDELLSKEFLDEKEIRFANFLMLKEMYKSKETEKELEVYKKAISELNFNIGIISEILVSQSKKELTNAQTRDEIIKYMNKIDFIFDEVKDKLGVDVFIKLRKELGCRDEV